MSLNNCHVALLAKNNLINTVGRRRIMNTRCKARREHRWRKVRKYLIAIIIRLIFGFPRWIMSILPGGSPCQWLMSFMSLYFGTRSNPSRNGALHSCMLPGGGLIQASNCCCEQKSYSNRFRPHMTSNLQAFGYKRARLGDLKAVHWLILSSASPPNPTMHRRSSRTCPPPPSYSSWEDTMKIRLSQRSWNARLTATSNPCIKRWTSHVHFS